MTTPMSDRNVSLPLGGRIIRFHSKETTPGLENIRSGKGRATTIARNLLKIVLYSRNEHGNPWP